MKKLLLLSLFVALFKLSFAKDKFEPNVESLRQYRCPEWFRDAKFGIWSCWNAYTVAGQGDWYARAMYMEGSRQYKYHCKTYGHPSKFGYKDVVDLWKGENFNPKEQLELFKEAGAKYFIAMANHHDNFDLWDSKYQPWNSVNYGPKRDIIKEWKEAVEEVGGLRWGITSHLERTWSWFQVNKLSDKQGDYKGVPYDGANPKYEQMYLPKEPNGDTSPTQPINATQWWKDYWFNRCVDLIDNYKPDLFYVDGGVPFPGEDQGKTGLKMIAHLYNKNASWHKGENQAVMCLKNWLRVAPKGEWGHYWDGIGTLDFERGRSSNIIPDPWQTDTYIGGWTWTPDIKYRPASNVILELIDVVSKNGNLLVNVSPRPDGTLDDEATAILKEIGEWMRVNGESIYGTRPWKISGTGSIRVVKKGDKDNLLYISSLKPLEGNAFHVPFIIENGKSKISKVTLLSSGEKMPFELGKDGLKITLPNQIEGKTAWVFKVEGRKMSEFDVTKFLPKKGKDQKQLIEIWQEVSHKKIIANDNKALAFDTYGNSIVLNGQNRIIGDRELEKYSVADLDATITGFKAVVTTKGEVYFGKEGALKRVVSGQKATRVAINKDGEVWFINSKNQLYRTKDGLKVDFVVNRAVDVSCGDNGLVIYAEDSGRLKFIRNGVVSKGALGYDITRLAISPKTEHIVTVYNGEIAISRAGAWLFTGIKASDVACGKINDDEIIGYIEK